MRIASGEEAIGGEDHCFHRGPCNKAPGSWSYRVGADFAGEVFDTEDAAKLAMFGAYWELSRED